MRTPRLTAEYAIGSALGHYQAASARCGGGAALAPMACGPMENECPPEGDLCCTATQYCYQRSDGTYVCLEYPPDPTTSSTSSTSSTYRLVSAPGSSVPARTGG